MGIWQDLVDAHGFAGGYQSVQRFVRGLRQATSPEARVIIETRISEECQVITGLVRWCATRRWENSGARGCS